MRRRRDKRGHFYSKEQRRRAGFTAVRKRYGPGIIEWRPGEEKRKAFATSLRYNHDMSVEEYARLWEAQKGVCPICSKAMDMGKPGSVHVDHNHKTGETRGLLHNYCNYRYLGHVERGGFQRWRGAGRYLGWDKKLADFVVENELVESTIDLVEP